MALADSSVDPLSHTMTAPGLVASPAMESRHSRVSEIPLKFRTMMQTFGSMFFKRKFSAVQPAIHFPRRKEFFLSFEPLGNRPRFLVDPGVEIDGPRNVFWDLVEESIMAGPDNPQTDHAKNSQK